MSDFDRFRQRVEALVDSLDGEVLNGMEVREVRHLVDHNEIGEALRTLAWIVVDGDKAISSEAYRSIVELSRGLIAEEHMPANLASHVDEDLSSD